MDWPWLGFGRNVPSAAHSLEPGVATDAGFPRAPGPEAVIGGAHDASPIEPPRVQ